MTKISYLPSTPSSFQVTHIPFLLQPLAWNIDRTTLSDDFVRQRANRHQDLMASKIRAQSECGTTNADPPPQPERTASGSTDIPQVSSTSFNEHFKDPDIHLYDGKSREKHQKEILCFLPDRSRPV